MLCRCVGEAEMLHDRHFPTIVARRTLASATTTIRIPLEERDALSCCLSLAAGTGRAFEGDEQSDRDETRR